MDNVSFLLGNPGLIVAKWKLSSRDCSLPVLPPLVKTLMSLFSRTTPQITVLPKPGPLIGHLSSQYTESVSINVALRFTHLHIYLFGIILPD